MLKKHYTLLFFRSYLYLFEWVTLSNKNHYLHFYLANCFWHRWSFTESCIFFSIQYSQSWLALLWNRSLIVAPFLRVSQWDRDISQMKMGEQELKCFAGNQSFWLWGPCVLLGCVCGNDKSHLRDSYGRNGPYGFRQSIVGLNYWTPLHAFVVF